MKPDLAMRIHHLAGMSVLAAVLYIQNSGSECIGKSTVVKEVHPFQLGEISEGGFFKLGGENFIVGRVLRKL